MFFFRAGLFPSLTRCDPICSDLHNEDSSADFPVNTIANSWVDKVVAAITTTMTNAK